MKLRRQAAVALAISALASPVHAAAATEPERWRPEPATTWQWQLTGQVDTSVPALVYDIDLFDNPARIVTRLHRKGRRVICYMSAGSSENWRPDAGAFPAWVKGRSNGWAGERWLDIRRMQALKPIMRARLDTCRSKGFDGVELDNVDGYVNRTGFPLTGSDQMTYNRWLAQAAHARGLSAGLKNDLGQIGELEPHFDFAINEECFNYDECGRLQAFIEAGKAVFHVEYELSVSSFCSRAQALGFSSMKKHWNLGSWRRKCW